MQDKDASLEPSTESAKLLSAPVPRGSADVVRRVAREGSLGVGFRPTDPELLSLLQKRVEEGTGHANVTELPGGPGALDPEILFNASDATPEAPPTRESARFFFCTRARARNGQWSRKTASGWWDQERNPTSFAPGEYTANRPQMVIFNHKTAGPGKATGLKWQMHEYQISRDEPLVLCKVMQVAEQPRRKPVKRQRSPAEQAESGVPDKPLGSRIRPRRPESASAESPWPEAAQGTRLEGLLDDVLRGRRPVVVSSGTERNATERGPAESLGELPDILLGQPLDAPTNLSAQAAGIRPLGPELPTVQPLSGATAESEIAAAIAPGTVLLTFPEPVNDVSNEDRMTWQNREDALRLVQRALSEAEGASPDKMAAVPPEQQAFRKGA
ncbi:hypothetical protein KFL_003330190 [Klebsormidium nitens]|uniref:NAC domain-containing protein n=1 Tax=Klebsormidium nitens TaxID=105231 RepID=A0A1Y1IEI6_KLENI|nr:hypothetical protein KFL_003330190 [Klebsormidium nitens]|eukprot:GAQ87136.1 hypothetical protein KFL_003330190 [Klebsormidium nitens]